MLYGSLSGCFDAKKFICVLVFVITLTVHSRLLKGTMQLFALEVGYLPHTWTVYMLMYEISLLNSLPNLIHIMSIQLVCLISKFSGKIYLFNDFQSFSFERLLQ